MCWEISGDLSRLGQSLLSKESNQGKKKDSAAYVEIYAVIALDWRGEWMGSVEGPWNTRWKAACPAACISTSRLYNIAKMPAMQSWHEAMPGGAHAV